MWPTTRTSTRDRWRSRCRDGVAWLAVVAAAVGVLGAGTALSKPRLELVAQHPVTARGAGFARYEPVRVRLLLPGREIVRRVRASRRGRFSVSFPGAAPDRCAGYSIIATGGSGSVARLRRTARGCPPAVAVA